MSEATFNHLAPSQSSASHIYMHKTNKNRKICPALSEPPKRFADPWAIAEVYNFKLLGFGVVYYMIITDNVNHQYLIINGNKLFKMNYSLNIILIKEVKQATLVSLKRRGDTFPFRMRLIMIEGSQDCDQSSS